MKNKIGILAYGSLIEDPGDEISPLIIKRIPCLTPFKVEYARSSSTRSYAATLIPHENGAFVNAVILVLNDSINVQQAKDMIWRREIRSAYASKSYVEKKKPTSNTVKVDLIMSFKSVDYVLYTSIGSNMDTINPNILADLAIKSILDEAGEKGLDGVRYLENAMKNGILTPMTESYKQHILTRTNAKDLTAAIQILDSKRKSSQ